MVRQGGEQRAQWSANDTPKGWDQVGRHLLEVIPGFALVINERIGHGIGRSVALIGGHEPGQFCWCHRGSQVVLKIGRQQRFQAMPQDRRCGQAFQGPALSQGGLRRRHALDYRQRIFGKKRIAALLAAPGHERVQAVGRLGWGDGRF